MAGPRTIALVVFCTATAAAQHYAHLYGRILDESDAGIGQATVTVIDQDTGFRRTAESEPDGGYAVSSLEAGVYKIDVRKDGFREVVQFGVALAAGASTRADFRLPIGRIGQSIIVVGWAPLLNHEDASTGSRFDREEIERLPLNGRGLLTLLELVPGTNVTPATRGEAGQFTTSGQRPNTNYFTVDGISANTGVAAGGLPAQFTGGALPVLSAFGSLDSLISLPAVEEFRVQTSTEVAEFGRLPGARVALTSRSGSNQFHGSASLRVRNELLSANDWFGNQAGYGRLPLRLLDAGAALGGPVRRNRTFFYLSYQRTVLTQPYVWRQPVPSIDARLSAPSWAGPALSLFPLPNNGTTAGMIGEWIGRTTRPASLHAGGARLDHAVTSRVTLFGRYNDSPSANQFGSFQVNALDFRFQSLTLGLTARPTANLVLDARANGSKATADSDWTQGAGSPGCELGSLPALFEVTATPCNFLVRFAISGIGQLVSGREGARRQRQVQFVETATWRRGNHSLGWGADYRDILAVRRDISPALGVIADSFQDLTNTSRLWIAQSDAQRPDTDVKELSLWMQDNWQATPRLTIAAGLRWEFSPAPLSKAKTSDFVEDATYFLDPVTGVLSQFPQPRPLWPESYGNLAPRLGLAWRLGQNGRTVLRAGAGLYYDSSLSIATDVLNGGPLSVSVLRGSTNGLFSSFVTFGFQENLRLPEVVQWNVALDRALGTHDLVSVAYVGSAGRNLLRRELSFPANSPTLLLALTTNGGSSDYHALQLEYRRRVARGLQAVASYTWSHTLDNVSSDAYLAWGGASPSLDHASSDFDLRHAFTTSLSYDFPMGDGAHPRLVRGWGVDAVFHARTGFPITVLGSDEYRGITLSNAFRPHLVAGVPVWIQDASAPGGKRLNPAAFLFVDDGVQGSLGRNVFTGFGMSQFDLALWREFRFSEPRRLEFRVEAFNALNHANFADPVRYLNSPMFGQSTAMLNLMLGSGSPGSGLAPLLQTGGPRTVQGSLRFQF